MKRKIITGAIIATLCASVLPVAVSAAEFRAVAHPVQDQYIVVLKAQSARLANESNRVIAPVDIVAGSMAASYHGTLLFSYDRVLRAFALRMPQAELKRMLLDPRVAYIQQDGRVRASTVQTAPPWNLDRIDQRDPTDDVHHTFDNTYTYATVANNVHAYVIDTGIYGAHTDFIGGGGASRVGTGYTAITDGHGDDDCNGHGTHVAGILGGNTYGVAKKVRLHPVRVLGCDGLGTSSQVVAGINWVAGHAVKPAVANLSLEAAIDPSIDSALSSLITSGVTVVAAAGNDSASACNFSPAHVAAAITVGSTRRDDARSVFSNYGTCVDLFAPGSSITSDWVLNDTSTATLSGTSMASPMVAGVAALYLADNPAALPGTVASYLLNVATPSRVLGAGTGSPNLMVSTLATHLAPLSVVAAPTESFSCMDTGGNNFSCTADSPLPGERIAYQWPADDNDFSSLLKGNPCVHVNPLPQRPTNFAVTQYLTVGNRSGSKSSVSNFVCTVGGEPL